MSTNGQESHPQADNYVHSAQQDTPHHPLDNVFSSDPQSGPILQMQTGLFELGRNRARLSGNTQPGLEDIRALEEHARAIARDTYREAFDPQKNAQDRMHQSEYDRLIELRREIEKGVAHAQANVHEAERALAAMPKAGVKPEANVWLVTAFIVAISVTVAPTLHDFIFFGIPDQLLAWFASSLPAAFVASMLTLAILHARKSTWTRAGVLAGVVLGLGLGSLRLSAARGPAEVLFAIGLTIMEISAVLLLEWLASGLRTREVDWLTVKLAEDRAIASRDAEITDLERRRKQLQEVSAEISQKIAYVEDRTHRNVHLPELEAVAIKAVLDGYNAGIAENVGRVRGATGRIS